MWSLDVRNQMELLTKAIWLIINMPYKPFRTVEVQYSIAQIFFMVDL